MSEKYRKCVKCGLSAAEEPSLTFHRFPKLVKEKPESLLKLRIWAEFCFPDKNSTDTIFLKKLYTSHKMLCSKHFATNSFNNNMLNKFAIPSEMKDLLHKLRKEASNNQVSAQAGPSLAGTSQLQKYVEESDTFTEPIYLSSDAEEVEIQTSNVTTGEYFTKTIPEARKHIKHNHNYILKPITVKKLQELSSTEKELYKMSRLCLKKISILINEWNQRNKTHQTSFIVKNRYVRKLFNSKISVSMGLLLQNQMKNWSNKPRGRLYNLEEQILALNLYQKSPVCYKLLRCMLPLPCQHTLESLLHKVPLKTGINRQVLNSLSKMLKNHLDDENICILMFGAMALKKSLTYNKRLDIIEGYQDHGKHGRTEDVATKSLVFMLSGVKKKWKQPIAYYFLGNYTTADTLVVLIKEVLEECFQVDLKVVATICRVSRVNIRALEILGSTKEKPYFNFLQNEIVTIFDPPHLLKCFRNLFLKHDVLCAADINCSDNTIVGTAKWSHIRTFHAKDKIHPFIVYAPAVTDAHLDPDKKQKKRVKLAAQIFSHSVTRGMLPKIALNELPAEAFATATFLHRMDELFDALNADSMDLRRGKKYSTNLTKKSGHLEFFKAMKIFISNMHFKDLKTKPPSQEAWILTINAIEKLWYNLKALCIKSLATRRLNQDALENCFWGIRYSCGSKYKPTVSQFIAGFKTAVLSGLKYSGRRRNCEDDSLVLANNLRSFLTPRVSESK